MDLKRTAVDDRGHILGPEGPPVCPLPLGAEGHSEDRLPVVGLAGLQEMHSRSPQNHLVARHRVTDARRRLPYVLLHRPPGRCITVQRLRPSHDRYPPPWTPGMRKLAPRPQALRRVDLALTCATCC